MAILYNYIYRIIQHILLYTVYNIEREEQKQKKHTFVGWVRMILRILDWLYCWTATFCLCMVRGIAPTRPSCHWMCGQTIVSILVRLVFCWEKCWVKDVCFFGTKPWVFQKNMTGNHEFPAWWSSYVLFVLLGSRLLFQGYPNTWILFTNISIYVHCFFRQVLTICNLSCFNSHFF